MYARTLQHTQTCVDTWQKWPLAHTCKTQTQTYVSTQSWLRLLWQYIPEQDTQTHRLSGVLGTQGTVFHAPKHASQGTQTHHRSDQGIRPRHTPHSHLATLLGLLLTLAGNLHPELAKVIAELRLFTLPLKSHTHIHSVYSTSPLTWTVSSLKGPMGTG